MGSGASKPEVTNTPNAAPSEGGGCPVKHQSGNAALSAAAAVPSSNNKNNNTEQNQPHASSTTTISVSKCPMHNKEDGSYSYDWWALFRPNFPHKPGGSSPLSPEAEARAKITRRASILDGTLASPGGGCPVTEYNVYAQPVDPKNNMPRMANQLPAAQQSKALSTQRVASSIPKVCA